MVLASLKQGYVEQVLGEKLSCRRAAAGREDKGRVKLSCRRAVASKLSCRRAVANKLSCRRAVASKLS